MIAMPSYIFSERSGSPQTWDISVVSDDYKTDLTNKCTFEFIDETPKEIKLNKNKVSIDKNKKSIPFQSRIKVSYKGEECFIGFYFN